VSEGSTRVAIGPRDVGKRLDRFLHERIPGLSRTRIQAAIRERVALSWGVRPRPATPVRAGGIVRIAHRRSEERPIDPGIPILAAGSGFVVVDKPARVPVHPVNGVVENSLIRMLRRQLGDPGLRLAHRLDRETTGVLLVAADAPTARLLGCAFQDGRVDKEYLALVAGDVSSDDGSIDAPIGPARESRVAVRLETGHGKPALTRWRVERRLEGSTFLRLFPQTGRRHQLRVHLEAIGHPILGDALYGRDDRDYLDLVAGTRDARLEEGGPRRQLLHGARLTVGEIDVEAPIPADFAL